MKQSKIYISNCVTCKGYTNELADTFEEALANAEEHTRVGEAIGSIPERPGIGHKWHKIVIVEGVIVFRYEEVQPNELS